MPEKFSNMKQIPIVMTAAIEVAVNQVLALDPDTVVRLRDINGKVIAIELQGLDVALYLIPSNTGLNVFGHFEGEPDTTLRGTPVGMLRMGLAENASDSFFAGEVEISGDVELGGQFREILDGLDIDWEEHLSQITGDVVAHRVGSFVRDAVDWGRKTLDTLGRDGAEYLQEESRDLPNRFETEEFLTAVDTLRTDVDRLEARVERLVSRRKNKENSQ
ncbi:Protein YigP (COG3165) clustered with ubiquinone biosynthetic genes [hydrothermal vent metagenome]|uniref:Protein YigP (COG3165) clustered with ubiquinone biosynthetic genes n=1 Tax=hydrothermal vent metagenome TaxID=652676 RepID=A0A3B1AJG0_9ZZZZ